MDTTLAKRLPMELILKIFNMVVCKQSTILLEDIRNYKQTNDLLFSLYRNHYDKKTDGAIYNLLCNEVWGYINDYNCYTEERTENFYLFWEKANICIKTYWFPPIYTANYPEPSPFKKRTTSQYIIDCYITRYFFKKTDKHCFNIIWD